MALSQYKDCFSRYRISIIGRETILSLFFTGKMTSLCWNPPPPRLHWLQQLFLQRMSHEAHHQDKKDPVPVDESMGILYSNELQWLNKNKKVSG